MKSQNQCNLILYITFQDTWGGTLKEVAARFAAENTIGLESKGYMRGESELGFIYYKGIGVGQHQTKAKEYFKKSCELGNEQATEFLMKLEGNNNSSNKKGCMGILLIPIILSIILSCVL